MHAELAGCALGFAQVALQLRFRLLDLEMMAAQISADTLLVDNTHPGPDFMLQASLQPCKPLLFPELLVFTTPRCMRCAYLASLWLIFPEETHIQHIPNLEMCVPNGPS